MNLICQVYRSTKEEGMYLFVRKDEGLTRVPENLLALFGKPQHAMVLNLTPERKLAHADVKMVLEKIREVGFYLQLPPKDQRDSDAERIGAHNSKLSH